MNAYLLLKNSLQSYFIANTPVQDWTGTGQPLTGFINIYRKENEVVS